MMMVPSMMTPTSRSMVNIWDSLELALSELDQRSSNSNSPRTMTKDLMIDLDKLSKDSFVLSKWIMKKARAKASTRRQSPSACNAIRHTDRHCSATHRPDDPLGD